MIIFIPGILDDEDDEVIQDRALELFKGYIRSLLNGDVVDEIGIAGLHEMWLQQQQYLKAEFLHQVPAWKES